MSFEDTPQVRLLTLTTSNEPPLESELNPIRQVIVQTHARLAAVNAELEALAARQQLLNEEKDALNAGLYLLSSAASLLRRIPPELLAEIFEWALPRQYTRPLYEAFDLNNSPWMFTHVCRHWRSVSLSTPSLWWYLNISFGTDATYPTYPLPLLERHMTLANRLRRLLFCSNLPSAGSTWTSAWCPALFPLLDDLRGRIPALRKLWIEWEDDVTPPDLTFPTCFREAPRLVDVGVRHASRYPEVLVPFSQLTRYTLHQSTQAQIAMLRSAPHLVEARITIEPDLRGLFRHSGTSKIVLPALRRLYVSDIEILDIIHAPVLTDFGYEPNGAPLASSDLARIIAATQPSLRRFCLYGEPTSTTAIQILQKFPSIEELRVIWNGALVPQRWKEADTLITVLLLSTYIDTGTPAIAPNLYMLSLGWESEPASDAEPFVPILRGRWKAGGSTIKRVELSTCSSTAIDPVVLNALKELQEERVDVAVFQDEEGMEITDTYQFAV
ncbi:ABC protein [Mycena kentingensis (nom. inval.)]|nr:ABC protein [Mycena kentingensis (nom. inval.)]